MSTSSPLSAARALSPLPVATFAGLALALLATASSAQNLVVNPSFETYSTCPTAPSQIANATGWNSPTTGSPDYDHVCGTSTTVQVPTNMWGTQAPKTGQAYAQMITYVGASASNFREYIQAPLTTPLVAGTSYQVSFWVSRGDNTQWACADIGAYLSVGPVGPIASFNPLPFTPQIQNTSGILTNATSWVQIQGTFVAAGGESHIVIGNFLGASASTATQVQTTGHNNAGYYIDDVSVTPLTGPLVSQHHLIGFADLPSPAPTGFIDMQMMSPNCPPAFTQCTTSFPKQAYTAWAGGTAYDPRYQTVWISDGAVLAEYYAAPAANCKARCPVTKATIQNNQALVTGLAISDRRSLLYQLASAPGAFELASYDISGASAKCLGTYKVCRYPMSQSSIATALAYDEQRDLLYINIAVKQPVGYQNVLFVSKASSPCTPVCQTKYFLCSNNLVTGLAYDACSKTLYATDGQVTEAIVVSNPLNCQIGQGTCCPKQTAPTWRGLAIVPGWKQNQTGMSCTGGNCPTCPTMSAFTAGDPSLGSPFVIGLQNAPANSFAALYFKIGGPASPGLSLPSPFCGTFYAFPWALSYPPSPTLGGSACSGQVQKILPIPPFASFCGLQLTTQWLVICPGTAGFGFGFSQAIDFTITSS